jgi:hypothetical protein
MFMLKVTVSSLAIAMLSIALLSLEKSPAPHPTFSPQPTPSVAQSSFTPAPPMSDSADDTAPQLKPITLTQNVAVPLPGTELTATLQDYRYGRGRDASGQEKVSAWANIQLTLPDGRQETVRWVFYETREIFGYRLHLDGSRSEVLIYVLPPS